LLARKEHAPAARRHAARDDLHQRRLAGAVVAEQRHHLAGADAETDAAQRLDGAEPAGDALQLQEGCRLGHHDTRDSGCCIIGSLSSRVSSWLNICPKRGESTDEIAEAAAPRSTTSRPSDSRSRGVVRLLRAATEFGSSPAAATRAASSSGDALPPMTMASGSNRFSTITTAERSSGATAVTQAARLWPGGRRSNASSDRWRSRQPRFPHGHQSPSGTTGRCPISPALFQAPRTTPPSLTRRPPSPTPK